MILGSRTKRVIGSRVVGVVDNQYRIHPNQPVVILREVTFDDWKKEVEESTGPIPPKVLKQVPPDAHFYEVSLD